MTTEWIVRFILGLPARVEDAAALLRSLPELKNQDFRLRHRDHFWYIRSHFSSNEEVLEALRDWVANIEVPDNFGVCECKLSDCPYRGSQAKMRENNQQTIMELQVIAGGHNANPPRSIFLDSVKRIHPESDPPQEIILTDPYIYSDISEDNQEGGFRNLIAYLEALGLSSDDSFILRMTPNPKRGTKTARKKLHRYLEAKFKNIQLKDYSPKLKFHDRFYVVRHQSGNIKGLFGPSINGLTSDAIVLIGDINELQPQKKLKEWFG